MGFRVYGVWGLWGLGFMGFRGLPSFSLRPARETGKNTRFGV